MKGRRSLRRVHIWLGWLVGVPLLFWTLSGLFMAAVPIETIRGEALIAKAPPLAPAGPIVPPLIGPRPVASVTLEQQHDGPKWIVRYADGGLRAADPATGRLLPPLTSAEAAEIIRSRYTGTSRIAAIDRTKADAPPLDLRQKVETWRVSMEDGTRFYVSRATGEILARRTSLWRVYDFLWGLHIMDLKTRHDFNHGWIIVFAAISAVSIIMALVLLPMAVWKRRRR